MRPPAIFPEPITRPQRVVALASLLSLVLVLLVGVAPAAAVGSLTGTVTGDGSPLADVTVELTTPGGGTVVASGTTSATGSYELAADAGTYDLVATPPGGSPYGPSTVTGVEVVDGVTRTVDVVLVTIGGIPAVNGTVTVDGAPAEAGIVLRDSRNTSRVEVTSNADGTWVAVPPLRSGLLFASAPGACGSTSVPEQWGVQTFFDVDTLTTYDIAPRFVRLDVEVLDAAGVPVEGAQVETSARESQPAAAPLSSTVTASNRGGSGCPAVLTDATGGASFATVPGGTTFVAITPPGATTPVQREVAVGDGATAVTVQLPPPPVTLSGTILGWDGAPARNVQVWVDGVLLGQASDGTFSVQVTPGTRALSLRGGNADEVGPNFRADRTIDVPEGVDVDLGTWQPPLSAVDLRVSLADTGEEIRATLNSASPRPSLAADVFGGPGTVSGGGFFFTNTTSIDTGPSVLLAGATYTLRPNPDQVPPGYEWPDAGWDVTGGATGTSSTASLALDRIVTGATVTGRILQDGSPVQGVVVAIDRDFVFTNADGTFELPAPVGTVDIDINSSTGAADAPEFAIGVLRNVEVTASGLDLGDLELPWVSLDVRVLTPPGDDPVVVEVETTFTDAFLDQGWGTMLWRGGYISATGDTTQVLADGSSNILWFTPSDSELGFTFSPIDPDSPYGDVGVTRTVSTGGDVLQVQLQRDGTPLDEPPTIGGLTPRSLGESAPNVRLSVGATDPEGEDVTVTWDVLGITPAPTGTFVDLGPFDGPLAFDAVATACDPGGNCSSFTIEVEIRDEPPTLDADLPSEVQVDAPALLSVTAADVRDPVTVEVDWGDGTTETVSGDTIEHAWAAAGTYEVTVRAITDDATTATTLPIEVVAPTQPEEEPTDEPSPTPTDEPTPEPTDEPTPEPTDEPTPEPTDEPSPTPTDEPTPEPTPAPTDAPTEQDGSDVLGGSLDQEGDEDLADAGAASGRLLVVAVLLLVLGVLALAWRRSSRWVADA